MKDKKPKSNQLSALNKMSANRTADHDLQFDAPARSDYADWSPRGGGYGGYGGYAAEDEVNLRDLWRKIFKHKWLIASIVLVVTTLVTIVVYDIKPWYRASATIEIGKENSMNLNAGEVAGGDATDPFYLININTQKLALTSYELLADVVVDQKLDQNPQVIAEIGKKPFYSFLSSSENKSPEKIEVINSAALKNRNQKSKNAPEENAPATEAGVKLAPFVDFLRNHTDVDQVRETRALEVAFTDEDPQLAADVTNSITKIFMQRNYSNQTERFNNSADWLENSTRQLKAKVEAAETALANYMRDNQIYAAELPGSDHQKNPTLTATKLTQLHDQYTRIQTERMLKQSLFDQLEQGRIAELPEVFSDPKIVEAQKQLDQLVTQAAELKARYGPENPKTVEIQNQIEALTTQIASSRDALNMKLKADYERAVQDEKSLGAALEQAKAAAVNENQASIKLNILQQDVDTQRALYTDFLQKTNQAKAKVAEQNNNIRVIESAQVPVKPVGPKHLIMIMTGFFLSLGTGIGLAFLIEYLDHTIKSIEDVEQYSQLPVLGLIPKSLSPATNAARALAGKMKKSPLSLTGTGDPSEILAENPTQITLLRSLINHSPVGEAYRTLRTSLLMSFAGSPPKTILITSCHPGEGKTTTAVNTAVSLTQLDAKVLLIDCDLRQPTVQRRLDLPPENGLSTYLSSNTALDELIQTTSIPNLSVLPCGQLPPNPAELISSNKMRDMLRELSKTYDHILLDSPPLLNVTDSVILSGLVDGTILVVNNGKTTREMLQRCRQELYNVHSKILGVVLNRVKIERDAIYSSPEYTSVSV